jgi:ferrochelatase
MADIASRPVGVLLAQLGTPDEPTPQAVRRYLKEFLSDTRVIDLNPLFWQIILRLIILRVRPAHSAALYRRIWTEEGSPLLVHSKAQAEGLQTRLGPDYRVVLGMTYGNPSIGAALAQFRAEGIERILVFPLYPQYSSSTTAPVYDAVIRAAGGRRCPLFLERKRDYPTLRFVPPYYDDPGYIAALAAIARETLAQAEQPPERVIFSYHGNPQRYIDEGDPYRVQCEATSRLLAEALDLPDGQWTTTFQSQFGREEWLRPYTDEVLTGLGQGGVRSAVVACPGFTADCLETLDEIGNEGEEQFRAGGGAHYAVVPCLNAQPRWLDALAAIARRETQGWVKV